MPTSLHIACAIGFLIAIIASEPVYFGRRLKAQIAAGASNARRNVHCLVMVVEWAIAAIALCEISTLCRR